MWQRLYCHVRLKHVWCQCFNHWPLGYSTEIDYRRQNLISTDSATKVDPRTVRVKKMYNGCRPITFFKYSFAIAERAKFPRMQWVTDGTKAKFMFLID